MLESLRSLAADDVNPLALPRLATQDGAGAARDDSPIGRAGSGGAGASPDYNFTLQVASPPSGRPQSSTRPGQRPAAPAAAPAATSGSGGGGSNKDGAGAEAWRSSSGSGAGSRGRRGPPRGRLAYCMGKAEDEVREKVYTSQFPASFADDADPGAGHDAERSGSKKRPTTAPREGRASAVPPQPPAAPPSAALSEGERGREPSIGASIAEKRVDEVSVEEQLAEQAANVQPPQQEFPRQGRFTSFEVALHCFRDELSTIVHQELQASSAALQKFVTGALGKACAEIRKEVDVNQLGRQMADTNAWIMNLLDEVIACKKAGDIAPVIAALKVMNSDIQELQDKVDFEGVYKALEETRLNIEFSPVLQALEEGRESAQADLGIMRKDMEGLNERMEVDTAKIIQECQKVEATQEKDMDDIREGFRKLAAQQDLDTTDIREDVQKMYAQHESDMSDLMEAVKKFHAQQDCDASEARDDLAKIFAKLESDANDAMTELRNIQDRMELDNSEMRDDLAKVYAKQGQDAADFQESFGRYLARNETDVVNIRDDLHNITEMQDTTFADFRDDFRRLMMQHETAASDSREDSRKLMIQRESDLSELRDHIRKLGAHSESNLEELARLKNSGDAHFTQVSESIRGINSQIEVGLNDFRDEVRKVKTQIDFAPVLDAVRRAYTSISGEVGEMKHSIDFGPVLKAIEKSKVTVDLSPVFAALDATVTKVDADVGGVLKEIRKLAVELEPKRLAEVLHSRRLEVDSTAVLHAIHEKKCSADVSEVLLKLARQDEGWRMDFAQVLDAIRESKPPPTDFTDVIRAIRDNRPNLDFSEVIRTIRDNRPAPVDLSAVLDAIKELRPALDLADVAGALRDTRQALRDQAQARRGAEASPERSRLGADMASVLDQLQQMRAELDPIRNAIAPLRLAIEDQRRVAPAPVDLTPVIEAVRDAARRNTPDLSTLLDEIRKVKRGIDDGKSVDFSPVIEEIRRSIGKVRAEVDFSPVLIAISRIQAMRPDNSEVLDAVRNCAAQSSVAPVVEAIRNIKVEVDNSQVLDAIGTSRTETLQLKELVLKQGLARAPASPNMWSAGQGGGSSTPPLGGEYSATPAAILEEVFRFKAEFVPMMRELQAQANTDMVLEDLRQLHLEVSDLKNLDFSPIVRALRDKAINVDLSGVLGEIAKVQKDVQQLRADLFRASQAAASGQRR